MDRMDLWDIGKARSGLSISHTCSSSMPRLGSRGQIETRLRRSPVQFLRN